MLYRMWIITECIHSMGQAIECVHSMAELWNVSIQWLKYTFNDPRHGMYKII